MKLITVEAAFSPEHAAEAKDAIEAQSDTVRAMDGCESYAVYQSSSGIAIVQRWHSLDAFDIYRSGAGFARLIGALKPLMSAPPVTTIAQVDS